MLPRAGMALCLSMASGDLRSVNLNLLPILHALLGAGSVTEAARRLHLSQSSVSGSLRALRDHFGDELLVRNGRESVLTPRATELLEPLDRLMASMGELLFSDSFAPEAADTQLIIASADYVEVLLAPGFADLLPRNQGSARVQFTHATLSDLPALGRGGVDLVIGPRRLLDRALEMVRVPVEELRRKRLWRDGHVVVRRRDADVSDESLEDYLAAPHASFRLDRVFAGNSEQLALEQHALAQNDRLLLPSLHTLLWVAAHSGYRAVVPESLARFYEGAFPLAVETPPFAIPDLDIEMLWHRRQDASARHRWLRECMVEVVGAAPFVPS